jgi:hypothetical protein
MACTQTLSGLTRDCLTSLGGIIEVLIANADDVATITIGSNKVTGITMSGQAKFKRYALRRGNGSMTSNVTVDSQNGVYYVENNVLMRFVRMDTAKRVEFMAIAQADTIAIVHDANGLYWLVGDKDYPLTLGSGGAGQTGEASSDRNGYDIPLYNQSPNLPVEINVGTGTGQVNISTIVS